MNDDFNNSQKRKSNLMIIYVILFLILICLLAGFLIWIINNPQKDPGPKPEPTPTELGKPVYDSLLLAMNDETKKNFSVDINNSKVNTFIFDKNTTKLYVNYTYNTDVVVMYDFTYNNEMNVDTLLNEITTNKKLPNYIGLSSYILASHVDETNYKKTINDYFHKEFSKITASQYASNVNVYLTGLTKNSDDSITVIDQFKVKVSDTSVIDAGYKDEVSNECKDYYNLLSYIINPAS